MCVCVNVYRDPMGMLETIKKMDIQNHLIACGRSMKMICSFVHTDSLPTKVSLFAKRAIFSFQMAIKVSIHFLDYI